MICAIKIVVTVLVFAFIVYGIIDYAIGKRKEGKDKKKGNNVQGGSAGNEPDGNGQQVQNNQQGQNEQRGQNQNADNRNIKDVRHVFIHETPELRIYGLLPYCFYLLALASLFLVYLTWHGVRKDIRNLYELKNKGKTECAADSVKCRCDSACVCVDSLKKNVSVGGQHGQKATSAK